MIRSRNASMDPFLGPRVLVAGADPGTCAVLGRLLGPGFDLVFCGLDSTLDSLASGHFDGLILDLGHGAFPGGRLLGEVRRRGLGLPRRIVFLSESPDSVAPPSAGEAVLMHKPVNGHALEMALRARPDVPDRPPRRIALGAPAARLAAGVS